MRILSFVFACAFPFSTILVGQEQLPVSPAPVPQVAPQEVAPQEKDWLEYYYQNPTPERFVSEVKQWAADGLIDDDSAKPTLIAFLSQVMHENPEEIAGWNEALSDLKPEQKQVLHTAMLFSQTEESDKVLIDLFGQRYLSQKMTMQPILELPLDEANTMHMLWGHFYASGSPLVLRRIILCFRFQDAPVDPKGVDMPEGYMPFYKLLPRIAYEGLVARGKNHPWIEKVLTKLHAEDESLMPLEKQGIYDVLSVLNPEKFPPTEETEEAV